METCRAKDATTQANDMLDSIPSNTYNKVWVVVQSLKGTCDWGTMPANLNCEYLKQIIAAVKARNKDVGIYSDYYAWQSIFKSLTACPEVGQYDLWYGYNDHQDNFNSYKSFGGFGLPSMKAYAVVNGLCGLSLGLDYKLWYHRSIKIITYLTIWTIICFIVSLNFSVWLFLWSLLHERCRIFTTVPETIEPLGSYSFNFML